MVHTRVSCSQVDPELVKNATTDPPLATTDCHGVTHAPVEGEQPGQTRKLADTVALSKLSDSGPMSIAWKADSPLLLRRMVGGVKHQVQQRNH